MKCKCSNGICKEATKSAYYCSKMNENGIFEVENNSAYWLLDVNWFCAYSNNQEVTWTRYDFECIMREVIKKHGEDKDEM
jgi:hypothetical protein